MATYKVIQDIEADDKLLGPLTLRQFVYAGATLFLVYISYLLIARGAAFLLIITLPPTVIVGFFAFPWGREQPTEVWALARVRFLVKPRKRVWDQTGVKELVTITAPKRVERVYTDGLSQTEVKSRLQALASTIDSRGWAIKNAAVSPYTPAAMITTGDNSERLIDPATMLGSASTDDATAYDDVLDPTNSPKAQQFDAMLEQNAQAQKQRLMAQMQQTTPTTPQSDNVGQAQKTTDDAVGADYWFLNQPSQQAATGNGTTFGSQVVPPGTQTSGSSKATADEQAIIEQLKGQEQKQSMQYSHLPTILPLSEQERQAKQAVQQSNSKPQPEPDASTPVSNPVTPEPDAAILELAQKDDWNISTIARQAKKAHGEEPDEVVISLH